MGNFNPKNPTKFRGTDKNITFFVSRNRRPTLADYRQPETGNLYSVGTVWQIGKDPTTGLEGDLWMLSKIVANQGYWIEISGGGGAGLVNEFTTDDMLTVLPNALGNVNVFGLGETSTQGNVANTIGILSPRTAKFIVDSTLNNGTHQTITAAMSDASSGDTIFIRPGTYTENLTLKAGVNLTTFSGEENHGQVEIVGKLSASFSGSASISGLRLTTNADYSIEMTGANATKLYVQGCDFNGADATSINVTNSSASSLFFIDNCTYTPSSGNTFITWSGAGVFRSRYTFFASVAGAVTSTFSAGIIFFKYCESNIPFTFSSSASLSAFSCNFNTQGLNLTPIVSNSTSATRTIQHSSLNGGTASAISIGAASSLSLFTCNIFSSNTSAIANSGILTYSGLSFTGSSSAIVGGTQTLVNEGPSRTIGSSNVGGSNVLTTTNTDNTNASSNAAIIASIGGTSGGDPYTSYIVGTARSFAVGIDNTDSDKYKWVTAADATATPSSGTQIMEMSPSGDGVIAGSWTVDKLKLDNATLSRIDAGAITLKPQAGSNLFFDAVLVNHGYDNAGGLTQSILQNNSATAGSRVQHDAAFANSTGKAAYSAIYSGSPRAYIWGIDAADSSRFKLGTEASATPTLDGSTAIMLATTAGEITYPLQPAFLAYLDTSVTDVTGDGTEYTVIYDTEVFDQGGDFNLGTSTFTAPVSGRYPINMQGSLIGGTILSTVICRITTSNRTYRITLPTNAAVTSTASQGASVLADMDAGDTFTITIQATDTAGKVDDVAGTTGGQLRNWVSAQLSV